LICGWGEEVELHRAHSERSKRTRESAQTEFGGGSCDLLTVRVHIRADQFSTVIHAEKIKREMKVR
jgi:hypothetical protein